MENGQYHGLLIPITACVTYMYMYTAKNSQHGGRSLGLGRGFNIGRCVCEILSAMVLVKDIP